MNVLPSTILTVHSVKPYEAEWTKVHPNTTFVEVDLTSDCYGTKSRTTRIWTTAEWTKVLRLRRFYS